jgi:hypothetical protein
MKKRRVKANPWSKREKKVKESTGKTGIAGKKKKMG